MKMEQSVPKRRNSRLFTYLPMNMEQTECSETPAYKIQTPGNYPEENIQQHLTCYAVTSPAQTVTIRCYEDTR